MSGGNYNPAVSVALVVRGALPANDGLAYVAAQLLGAFGAGAFASQLAGASSSFATAGMIGHPAVAPTSSLLSAVLAEIIITFALCFVVLHTATTSFAKGKSYYGLAIGFTVVSGAISVGSISGGAFNPAVSMLNLVAGDTSAIWVYWLGPLLGGALAGALFRLTHPDEVDSSVDKPIYTDLIVEFIGTFLLGFTVACAAAPSNASGLAPLSIGAMLMAVVYAGGPTSGGHYNPAVTLAVFLRSTVFDKGDGLSAAKAGAYVLIQLVAGLVAAFAGCMVVGEIGFPAPADGVPLGLVWCVEALATFLLAFVVLQSATSSETDGNSFFGLAIGFAVLAMAVAIGGISGGALNPAVGLLGLMNGATTSSIAIYITACPAGAVLAALAFRVTNSKEFEATEVMGEHVYNKA